LRDLANKRTNKQTNKVKA